MALDTEIIIEVFSRSAAAEPAPQGPLLLLSKARPNPLHFERGLYQIPL